MVAGLFYETLAPAYATTTACTDSSRSRWNRRLPAHAATAGCRANRVLDLGREHILDAAFDHVLSAIDDELKPSSMQAPSPLCIHPLRSAAAVCSGCFQ